MKKISIFICSLLLVVIIAQTEQEMKAWQDYMTPSEVHKMMASWNGKWEGEIKMWMDSATPANLSQGIVENTMIMDGRYQEATFTGEFSGMPMTGKSLLAFDNQTKEFISTWIDNFGTGIMILKGKWDEKTQTINFNGTAVDPISGTEVNTRETFKIIDENTQYMEIFYEKEGKEFKIMEVKYTRVK